MLGPQADSVTTGEATAAREFWRGLTRPSLGALLITLAVPVVALALCWSLITPELLASEAHRYFGRDGTDGDLFVAARLAALSRATPAKPVVAILGGSAIVESVTNPSSVERSLESNGIDAVVWGLASWGQSLEASLFIVRQLPPRLDGVVLIGVTPFGMALGPAGRPGTPLDSSRAGEADEPGLALITDTGNFFWENRRFFLPRLGYVARNLWQGPVAYQLHPFAARKEPMAESRWQRIDPLVTKRVTESYEANLEASLRTLELIATEARSRGRVEVVILESPISPRTITDVLGEEFWAAHQRTLAAFAAARGIHYWFLQDAAGLRSRDFWDLNHLYRWRAIERHTRILTARTGELLRSQAEAR